METTEPKSSLVAEDMPVLVAEKDADSEAELSPRRSTLFNSETWTGNMSPRLKKSKRARAVLTYSVFGVISFIVFLYVSFPFNVVKEVAVSNVNEIFIQMKSPMRLSVASFRPRFPLGLNFEDIQLSNVNDPLANVKIGKASVSIGVIPLFWGSVSTNLKLTQSGGSLEVDSSQSIRSLTKMGSVRGARLPPGNFRVDFSSFEIKPFIANALAYVRSSNDPSLQTIQSFLRTEVSGQISGVVKVSLPDPGESFDKALADIDLKIGKAYFELKDENLAIPRQEFTESRIKAKLNKKSLEVLQETKFIANDLGVELAGRMNISDALDITDVKLNLGLALRGKIEENFKNLLPILLKCETSKMIAGKMNVELSGNFAALSCH
ncbi:type II secretion system protein GspN [bacterium]|nr:type II secretion system protein GspN [bacterium]